MTNEDNVFHCKVCLGLHIKTMNVTKGGNREVDYCADCGSIEIEESDYTEWERKYKSSKSKINAVFKDKGYIL